MIATAALCVLIPVWGILSGAVVYEHVALVPVWAAAPPASLTMWRGEHRVRSERFWIIVHPVLVVLLVVAIATSWSNDAARGWLWFAFGTYAVVLVVTRLWFVPELLRLTLGPDGSIAPDEWRRRARRWEVASLVRGVVVLAVAAPLLAALLSVGGAT